MIIDEVSKFLKKYQLEDKTIIVGFSGGFIFFGGSFNQNAANLLPFFGFRLPRQHIVGRFDFGFHFKQIFQRTADGLGHFKAETAVAPRMYRGA